MTDSAPQIIRRWERMAADRALWESNWQLIADYVIGRRDFLTANTAGQRRDSRIFDSTGMMAADTLAASLQGMMTDPSSKWFSLRVDDDALSQSEAVQLWLEDAADAMYAVFGDPEGMHAQACHEFYLDLGTFATAGMFIGDVPGKGVLFSARALGELYVAEDARGKIDTVFRKFKYTARQAYQDFGDRVGPKVMSALEDSKNPDKTFEYLHGVYPRKERDTTKYNRENMEFASCYVSLEDKVIVSEGGFREMPYMVARWSKDAGETYGRGPGWNALPDQKMLHAMGRTTIRAAQKVVDPPLMVADDGVIMPVKTTPGGLNFGRMDANTGRGEFIKPLLTGGRIDIGLEMENQRRDAIRSAFFADVLRMMRDPKMTAEQVRALRDEMLRTMGPVFGRLQSEFLGPMIDRTFAILWRQNRIPPPPQELSGAPLRVEYVSPLAKAQKASEARATRGVLQTGLELAQVDPGAMDNIDVDQAMHVIAEADGAPMKIIRDPKVVAEMRKARQEVLQRQAALETATQIGETAAKVMPAMTEMMQPQGR